MADITTGMKVTGISQYKNAMTQAQASVKQLDAALKRNEAQFKVTGDKEQYMADKARLLNSRMQAQKAAAQQAQAALKTMESQGVSKVSKAYQDMLTKLNEAQTGMLNTKVELNSLTEAEIEAAAGADKLTTSVNGISKKVSLDAVINGVGKITNGLESAAKKAVQLGQAIFDAVVDSAERADNTATAASILGMSIEDYQRYAKVFDTVADITVSEWQKAKQKVNNAIYSPSSDQTAALEALGISTHKNTFVWNKSIKTAEKNYEDLFWEIGATLRAKVQSGKLSQGLADDYANAIFGKSWANLNPIFDLGRTAFEEAWKNQIVTSEESITKLAEWHDQLIKLQGDFKTLQDEVLAGLAPALKTAAEVLSGLLSELNEYLKTDKGKAALQQLSDSVSGLFEDLGKIDPESVVENFTKVFDNLIKGFEWLTVHKNDVVNALAGIVDGWAGLKLTGAALQIWQMISGLRGFAGGGGSAGTNLSAVGTAAGLGGRTGKSLNFVSRLLSGGAGSASGIVSVATNGVALSDFLINNTPVGQALRDTGDIGAAFDVVKKYFTETIPKNWKEFWDTSYWGEIADFYTDSVGTTSALIQKGAGDLTEKVNEILTNTVAQFVLDSVETVANTPEAVNQVMNTSPEQNKNAFQKIIDTFLHGDNKVDVPAELDIDPEEAQREASKITVQIGARIVPVSFSGGGGGGGGGKFGVLQFHANGIWSVPFDGYPAILHRGERVVPAREVSSRSYNSNLYVEKMYMNSGTDAEGLAAAMAAAQRRRMSGYGG